MKKNFKTFKLLLIAVMLMLSTGCVKYNMTMDIKKDKSMDFSMIVAVDESMNTDGDDSDISSLKDEVKNKYCSVSDYNESNMVGASILCKFPNIDDLSSEGAIEEVDVEEILTDENVKLFQVKKGFFKNIYTLKIDSSSSSDDLMSGDDSYRLDDDYDDDDDLDYDDDDYYYDDDDDYDYYDDDDSDDLFDSSDIDYTTAMKSMDLKFEVKLPYKAISSNATSEKDGDKHLTWNLMNLYQNDDSDIKLDFPVYNISNIAILVVIVIALIAIGVIFFMKKKKKNVTGVTNMNTNNNMVNPTNGPQDMFGNNFPINNTGVTVMPTETNNNMNNVNSVNSTNNMSNMNMGTSTGFNNDVTIDNAVNTNAVMPSTGTSVEVPVTSVQSEGVNNGVEPASLTNVPNPVNDVSRNDDLI